MDLLTYSSIISILSGITKTNKVINKFEKTDMPVVLTAISTIPALLSEYGIEVDIKKYIVDVKADTSYMFISIQNTKVKTMIEYYVLSKTYDGVDFIGVKSPYVNRSMSSDNIMKESELLSESIQEKAKLLRTLFKENYEVNDPDSDEALADVAKMGSEIKLDLTETADKGINLDKADEIIDILLTYTITDRTGNNITGIIEVKDNSLFSIVSEDNNDDYYADLTKPNKLYQMIGSNFMILDEDKYLRAYRYMVQGDKDIDMVEEYVRGEIQKLPYDEFFRIEEEQRMVVASDVSNEGKLTAIPFNEVGADMLLAIMGRIPEGVDKTALSIMPVDVREDIVDQVVLVGECLYSFSHMKKFPHLYTEASLQQSATNFIRTLKGLPGDVYDKYKELQQGIKTSIRNYRKAEEDKLREEIFNDEYIPAFKKMIAFIAGLAVSQVLVFTGLVSPFTGLLAGTAVYVIKRIKDEEKRARALNILRDEIDMLDEKIGDARSENDKKAKYELIRLKNDLLEKLDKMRVRK